MASQGNNSYLLFLTPFFFLWRIRW